MVLNLREYWEGDFESELIFHSCYETHEGAEFESSSQGLVDYYDYEILKVEVRQ